LCYITLYDPFGFLASEVLERCTERNIPVYRTDAQGAVHAVSDGLKWTISSEQ
jgi:beta-lactamase superfamily II metal-dependent hydrolase